MEKLNSHIFTVFIFLGLSLSLILFSCSNEKFEGSERLTDISFEEKLSIVGDGSNPEKDFLRPFQVQLDPDDNIYVADDELPHVFVYNQEGAFLNRFGNSGRGRENYSRYEVLVLLTAQFTCGIATFSGLVNLI